MTNRVDIKVDGNADLSKIMDALDRTRKRAKDLEDQLNDARGAISKLSQAGDFASDQGKKGLSHLTNLVAGGVGAGAMYSRVSGGMNQYKQHLIMLDEEARSVKRLGQAYRDYQQQVTNAGRAYGFSNDEVIGVSSMFARTRGRAGADQQIGDMKTAQGFARSYGMGAMESGSYFNRALQSGIGRQGSDVSGMREFSGILADAIAQGGMQGREGEVINSILSLSQTMNSKLLTNQGSAFGAGALATLNATGVPGLQGEKGAALLGQMNQAIQQPGGGEAGDLFMYRALSGGQGGMSYSDYSYLKEEGIGGVNDQTGKTNLQATMEAVNNMGLKGRYRLMAASNLTGMSMHQYEGLENAFMGDDGQFNAAKMGNLQQRLGPEGMQQVDSSWWSMLGELSNGGKASDVAQEFEAVTKTKLGVDTNSNTAVFDAIKSYGTNHVAMNEGQDREALDNNIAKASEDAGAKLYDLKTAADKLTLAFMQMSGALPGPLGGIAPIMLGGLGGNLLSQGAQGLLNKGAPMVKGLLDRAGGAAANAIMPNSISILGAEEGAAATTAAGGSAASQTAASGVFASTAAKAFGVLAAAYIGAEIGSAISKSMGGHGFLDDYHKDVIKQGLNNVMSNKVNMGDLNSAEGALAMSVPGVIAGGLTGAVSAATGGSFSEGYDSGFFNVNRFDSAGRREWQARQQAQQNAAPISGTVQAIDATSNTVTIAGPDGQSQQIQLTGAANVAVGASVQAGQPLVAVGPDTGMQGVDLEGQAKKIDAILKGTGMEGRGMLIATMAARYNVPAELALAQFLQQSQFNSSGSSPRNNNPANLKYTGQYGDDKQGESGYAHFPSVESGIEGYFKMLSSQDYAAEMDKGRQTGDWSALSNKFAPESGDLKGQAAQTNDWTNQYHNQITSSRGGWWDVGADDAPALLHKREMVLPAGLAEALRNQIVKPGINENEARGAAQSMHITIDPIMIRLPDGSVQSATASGSYAPFAGVRDKPTGGGL